MKRNCIAIKNQNLFTIINQRISSVNNGATVIVPNLCSTSHNFLSGFSKEVGRKFPAVKLNFDLLGKNLKLGHTQFVSVTKTEKDSNNIVFANMIAQNGFMNKSNIRPLNYEMLVSCMQKVRSYIKNINDDRTKKIEIHTVKFAGRHCGANWNFVSDLIEDIWSDIPVFVYSYNLIFSNS